MPLSPGSPGLQVPSYQLGVGHGELQREVGGRPARVGDHELSQLTSDLTSTVQRGVVAADHGDEFVEDMLTGSKGLRTLTAA